MSRVAIVDYGCGNLASLKNSLASLGFRARVTADPHTLLSMERVILPGVGAFAPAAARLRETGLDRVIREIAGSSTPLLGICLGMQLLFSQSRENGVHNGLDIIKGDVRPVETALKLPHMGWNNLDFSGTEPLFAGLGQEVFVYFVHSFCCVPEDSKCITAVTGYGETIVAGVRQDNVYGLQFHPEKSSDAGLNVLANFMK